MESKVSEFFGVCVADGRAEWREVSRRQMCPFSGRKCTKVRKSDPGTSIGTCVLEYRGESVIVCPVRLSEGGRAFADCVPLLSMHEPGNDLHAVPEMSVPGGSVDYFLVSVKDGRVADFLGVEFQTMDTTGTVWPERQRLMIELGVIERDPDSGSRKSFGMNWKMTAKTTLMQMHHKAETFERLGKRLVLVIQKPFLEYMRREFSFAHISEASATDAIRIHSYDVERSGGSLRLRLDEALGTDSSGIAKAMGLKAEQDMDPREVAEALESRMSPETLLRIR
ncbi:MAG: hypothetical protein LBG62_01915 [Candidatus Methanoplasma sp.]|jgi:hypothetical protein|nr:hypothetical protein [Candidatus Methanoplasma sp.]